MIRARKPLDVARWGKLEVWEGMDAAYIIGGTEPEYGPNATLTDRATDIHRAMKSSMVVRALAPCQIAADGTVYFLAAEVIGWANGKNFNLPDGLEAAVHATARAYIERHDEAKKNKAREVEAAAAPDIQMQPAQPREPMTLGDVLPISTPQAAQTNEMTPAAWIVKAQDFASAYIDRHKEQGLFPTQADVCGHVETKLRENKIFGSHDKPLSAAYIGRNAIQGAWWKQNKP